MEGNQHFVIIILNADTNPLRKIIVVNETDPPSVQCTFTDDVMITNKYSTGCKVYYTHMTNPVHVMRKSHSSTNATANVTDISNSGYYDICLANVPSPQHCLDSVYIDVKSGMKLIIVFYLILIFIFS